MKSICKKKYAHVAVQEIMIISGASNDENFIKMMTFLFQCVHV